MDNFATTLSPGLFSDINDGKIVLSYIMIFVTPYIHDINMNHNNTNACTIVIIQ